MTVGRPTANNAAIGFITNMDNTTRDHGDISQIFYKLIIEILKTFNAGILILIIQSGPKFAHVMWQLSCYDMCKIGTWSNNFSPKHNFFLQDLDYELMSHMWHGF